VQYKNGARKDKRVYIARVGDITLHEARRQAKKIIAQIRLGRDPAAERADLRQRAADTVGALVPDFLAWQRDRLKPRSFLEVERHLVSHFKPLHSQPITVSRRTISDRLKEIVKRNGPGAANKARAALSGFFSWAIREGYGVESNPVAYTNKSEENVRKRVLDADELVAIWRAAGADDYGVIIQLLILTGARREEIGALRWAEIDFDKAVITLPGEREGRTKNRRDHLIPLSPAALQLLQAQPRRLEASGREREHVFGDGPHGGWRGWSRSKRDLDARLAAAGTPITDWRPHDFRRSFSTTMHEELNVPPHVVEVMLGHVGHQKGVAGTYNRALYLPERFRALERWAEYIDGLVAGKSKAPATVIQLHAS
jgi:integrase